MLLPFTLLLAAAPAGPSPATLKGVTFYDETFVKQAAPVHLHERSWPSMTFPSPGVAVVDSGTEVERYAFSAELQPDGSWRLSVRNDSSGSKGFAVWRWLTKDRAETSLWAWWRPDTTIASRARPTPEEIRDTTGERLAAAELPRGAWRRGATAFTVQADGGVKWSGKPTSRGIFFRCTDECAADAGSFVCLELPERKTYLFHGTADGGVIGAEAVTANLCAAGCPADAQRELVTGGEEFRRQ